MISFKVSEGDLMQTDAKYDRVYGTDVQISADNRTVLNGSYFYLHRSLNLLTQDVRHEYSKWPENRICL